MALLVFEGAMGTRGEVIKVPFITKQSVTSGNASAAFNRSTQVVTVHATVAGNVSFGTATVDPSAATSADFPLAADEKASFEVQGGKKLFWQE